MDEESNGHVPDIDHVMREALQKAALHDAIEGLEGACVTMRQSRMAVRKDLDQLAAELTIADGGWEAQLSTRDYKEVLFAKTYAMQYRHGTAGHNRLMLIAQLAERLDMYEATIKNCLRENKGRGDGTAVSNEV